MLPGQRADRGAHLVADPGHHELGERPVVVGDAERRKLRADQLTSRIHNGLQHLGDGQLVADRQHGLGEATRRAELIAGGHGAHDSDGRRGARHTTVLGPWSDPEPVRGPIRSAGRSGRVET